jgi:hypothetical protein
MKKESSKGLIVIGAIILACLSIPVGIISYTSYFAWDSQQSGELYKPAFETGGKLYELKMQGGTLAFDEGEAEDHLYLNSPYSVGEFIALAYGDFRIEKTENPYFAGIVAFNNNKYHTDETKFRSPTEKYYVYTYYDQNRAPIFTYEPETESEFVQKLRPTFPAFSKRKYSIGNKRDFIDVTKLLKAKLGKNLKVRADEANKLLVISFE